MLKCVVTATTLTWLMLGAALAVEDAAGTAPEDPCGQQLAAVEEAVATRQENAPLSEDQFNKVNELLDQADAQCTEGNLPEATATLATVNGIIQK